MTLTNIMTDKRFNLFDECKVFQIVVRVGGGNFTGDRWGGGGIFLPGEGNLRRRDFDNSNFLQS